MSPAAVHSVESTRSVPADSVLLIGAESLERAILHLFASSHWTLVREASLDRALELVESAHIPVVLCDDADVLTIEAAVSKLHPRPVVIALSTNDRFGAGIHARGRSAFLLNVHRIAAGEWFSLINHAWRTTHERNGL
jgi:hypothetical protein